MFAALAIPPKMSWDAWIKNPFSHIAQTINGKPLTLATVVTGLRSVCPEDCTPINEKKNPRTRERIASPTFMEKSLARIAQDIMMLIKTPTVHHDVGMRSSTGV